MTPAAAATHVTLDRLGPLLQQAIDECPATHTFHTVMEAITEGRAHLWCGERCVAVTEFNEQPLRRILNVWLAGGDLREMKSLRPGIEAFGRAHGATAVTFSAKLTVAAKRRLSGWTRASGYEPRWINHYKELTP